MIKNDRNKSDMPKKVYRGAVWEKVVDCGRGEGVGGQRFVPFCQHFFQIFAHFDLIFASFWVYYYIVNEKQRHLHHNIILYYIF